MEELEYWYQALRATGPGVCIRTTDRERTRAKLYQVRKEAMDPALAGISVVFSPTTENELWLVRRG